MFRRGRGDWIVRGTVQTMGASDDEKVRADLLERLPAVPSAASDAATTIDELLNAAPEQPLSGRRGTVTRELFGRVPDMPAGENE